MGRVLCVLVVLCAAGFPASGAPPHRKLLQHFHEHSDGHQPGGAAAHAAHAAAVHQLAHPAADSPIIAPLLPGAAWPLTAPGPGSADPTSAPAQAQWSHPGHQHQQQPGVAAALPVGALQSVATGWPSGVPGPPQPTLFGGWVDRPGGSDSDTDDDFEDYVADYDGDYGGWAPDPFAGPAGAGLLPGLLGSLQPPANSSPGQPPLSTIYDLLDSLFRAPPPGPSPDFDPLGSIMAAGADLLSRIRAAAASMAAPAPPAAAGGAHWHPAPNGALSPPNATLGVHHRNVVGNWTPPSTLNDSSWGGAWGDGGWGALQGALLSALLPGADAPVGINLTAVLANASASSNAAQLVLDDWQGRLAQLRQQFVASVRAAAAASAQPGLDPAAALANLTAMAAAVSDDLTEQLNRTLALQPPPEQLPVVVSQLLARLALPGRGRLPGQRPAAALPRGGWTPNPWLDDPATGAGGRHAVQVVGFSVGPLLPAAGSNSSGAPTLATHGASGVGGASASGAPAARAWPRGPALPPSIQADSEGHADDLRADQAVAAILQAPSVPPPQPSAWDPATPQSTLLSAAAEAAPSPQPGLSSGAFALRLPQCSALAAAALVAALLLA